MAQFGLGALTHEDSFTILIPIVRIKLCFWEGLLVFEMKLLKVGHKGMSEGKCDDIRLARRALGSARPGAATSRAQ